MPLSPLQRKAEFAKAAVLHEATLDEAARSLGVSWNHVGLCLSGERVPSAELAHRIADYCGMSATTFWGTHIGGNRAPAVAR